MSAAMSIIGLCPRRSGHNPGPWPGTCCHRMGEWVCGKPRVPWGVEVIREVQP